MGERSLWYVLAGLCFAAGGGELALAGEGEETRLILPQSSEDMRKYMSPANARCPGCGVVTNLRQVNPEEDDVVVRSEASMELRTGDAGVGEDIQAVPIFRSGASSAREERQEAARLPTRPWRITVRYDDGSFATFDQDEPPGVSRGQRVHVVSGRVEPR